MSGVGKVGPVFYWNYQSDKRLVVNRGGSRSGKTYALMQLAVNFLFTGYVRPGVTVDFGVWSVVRKTLPALKASALRDFEEILLNLGLYDQVEVNKSERTYTFTAYEKNKVIKQRTVEFFSIDDQQKVRGRARTVLHINEANEVDYANDFRQLQLRTTDRTYIDFNPDDPFTWIKTEIEDKRQHIKKDVAVIVSSYKDNPFLKEDIKEEIIGLSEEDEDFAAAFARGEYGSIRALVYPKVSIIGEVPEGARFVGRGLDFGFTNDPSSLIDVWRKGDDLILDEWIYETGLTNQDLSEKFEELGLEKDERIIADSAEPKSIQELVNMGWDVIGVEKGKNSILTGIGIIKKYNIYITSRSTGIIKEQRRYKFKLDQNGHPTNKPIDRFNHAWDAARYVAITNLLDEDDTREPYSPGIYTARPRV